jgi:hypothetical protein
MMNSVKTGVGLKIANISGLISKTADTERLSISTIGC